MDFFLPCILFKFTLIKFHKRKTNTIANLSPYNLTGTALEVRITLYMSLRCFSSLPVITYARYFVVFIKVVYLGMRDAYIRRNTGITRRIHMTLPQCPSSYWATAAAWGCPVLLIGCCTLHNFCMRAAIGERHGCAFDPHGPASMQLS